MVMGQSVSMPVLISPTGVQAVHPDGEVAVARAAAARGVAIGLSSFASKPIEDVIAANPQTFFQIYWAGDRDSIVARMERAPGGGRGRDDRHARLVVRAQPRLGQPEDPVGDRLRRRSATHALESALKPRWLLDWARSAVAARPHRPQLRRRRRASARLLRGLRHLDEHTAADVGRHRLAARAVGRPVHGEGHRPRRRGAARRRRRCVGDLGLEPRRQQPRRHAGADPRAARGGRRGRRPGRGA